MGAASPRWRSSTGIGRVLQSVRSPEHGNVIFGIFNIVVIHPNHHHMRVSLLVWVKTSLKRGEMCCILPFTIILASIGSSSSSLWSYFGYNNSSSTSAIASKNGSQEYTPITAVKLDNGVHGVGTGAISFFPLLYTVASAIYLIIACMSLYQSNVTVAV